MAKIKKLGMAEELLANPHISVRKSCLGLVTNYIYNPTGGKIKVVQRVCVRDVHVLTMC